MLLVLTSKANVVVSVAFVSFFKGRAVGDVGRCGHDGGGGQRRRGRKPRRRRCRATLAALRAVDAAVLRRRVHQPRPAPLGRSQPAPPTGQ